MRYLLFLSAILCSCHGTSWSVGTGHAFNKGGGSFSSLGDVDDHGGGGMSSGGFDIGDTTSVWTELSFQLTPRTMVVEQGPLLSPSSPPVAPLLPKIPAPIDYIPAFKAIEVRLLAIETEAKEHLSLTKIIGVGGASGTGGAALIAALLLCLRKRKE